MKSLKSINPEGKKFLVRCDLDVLNQDGEISDYYRLESSLKTLNFILENEGFAYICGHIGKTMEPNEKFSTKKLFSFYEKNLKGNSFEIMENLRFDSREEKKDFSFATEISLGKDYYVNESFATSHRNHSSITLIPEILPSFIGIHFEEEIENLNYILEASHKPLVVIIGGAKVESKKPTIDKFLKLADYILVGGKLSFEESLKNQDKIILASDFKDNSDIGEETIKNFKKYIFEAKTIFWSGPLGKIEEEMYSQGTKKIVEYISKSGAYSVCGGGDTISFLEKNDLLHKFSFVSVGGSAMLEFLSSSTLIGLEAVKKSGS
jgi:phosphoglycerate kinase